MTFQRPKDLNAIVGQNRAKSIIQMLAVSGKSTGRPMSHLLIAGGPGLGKTTLAQATASFVGVSIQCVHAATLRKKSDIISILVGIRPNSILFIDEIQALELPICELLYTAMEDFHISVAMHGECIQFELNPFTLIGATTRIGSIPKPLLDRFGETILLEEYEIPELVQIVKANVNQREFTIDEDAAFSIAKRCNATPRILNRLTARCVDYVVSKSRAHVDLESVLQTCELIGVDDLGLDRSMLKYLKFLRGRGKPTSLKLIASSLNEAPETIETIIEPPLITLGFVERASNGRTISTKGSLHVSGQM